jgi:uroporphyrinogen III methyltransferase / synthase
MNLPIKIGSRGSRLAIAQVHEVLGLLGQRAETQLITFQTKGDKDKTTPLTSQPADDFFTDTLDEALIQNSIDIAVHSAKDLPKTLRDGLEIFALTKSVGDADAWVSNYSWDNLPKGAKVGTSSLLRQSQVKELRPDVTIVDIRGTIEERIELVKQGKVDGIIVAACALERLGLKDTIKDLFPWEGMPLQGQLAIVGRSADQDLKNFFEFIDVRRQYGKVTLVGAGPGDAELITLKGLKALSGCDCVFYDYLVDKNILKHAPQAEHIYAGKRKGDHTLTQSELSRLLRLKAMDGKNVVRLKGGDPLIFGRGADEIQYLSQYHIETQVIPGVTSATGIPSYLGVPLTARGVSSSVAFVSGHEEDEDKAGNAKPVRIPSAETIVFLMGLTKLNQIVMSLKNSGWVDQTPVMIISQGTKADEQIVKGHLNDIEDLVEKTKLKPPALIIVGKTVDFYRPKPQKTFLHCGTNPELYAGLGKIIPWPMIEIKSKEFSTDEKNKLKNDFKKADLVVLTSPSAVAHFMPLMLSMLTLEELKAKLFAVIGRQTGRNLENFGVTAQIISAEETAQGFFKTLSTIMQVKGKTILFPRSSLPNPFLKDSLVNQGANVLEWTVYENTKPVFKELPQRNIHGVIFTSPSTFNNFIDDYKAFPKDWQILAKGPATQAAITAAGYNTIKVLS